MKLYLREPLHAKLYLAHCPSDTLHSITSLMGSSNLTYSGLTGNGELNALFGDDDQNDKFAVWFDRRISGLCYCQGLGERLELWQST